MISGQVPVRQIDVHDTWAARDLPVLDATIGLLEHSYMVTVVDIAAKTGLAPSVVAQALDALNPVYVDFRKTTTGGDPSFWYVFKVTPEARRAVGQWPTAEALVSRLAEELSIAARRDGDADSQGLLAYAARLIGDTLRDATLRAAGAVLAPAFNGIPVPEMGQPVPPPAPLPVVEFQSLVQLPELPELLRPQQSDGLSQVTSVTAQPEDVPAPVLETAAPEPAAPEPPVLESAVPEPAAPEPAAPEPPVLKSAVPEPAAPEPAAPDPAAFDWLTPAPPAAIGEDEMATPAEPSAEVPDLNPWPDGSGSADASAAAHDLADEAQPGAFRPSLGTWPAADADADATDVDLNLVEARNDAV